MPTPPTPQQMVGDCAATAAQLRTDGNALYRDGNLTQAAEKYLSALALSADDIAARRNLSSVRFELGDYSGCLGAIQDALPLEEDEKKKLGLKVRQAKCYLYLNRPADAKEAVKGLEAVVKEAARIAVAATNRVEFSEEEKKKARVETVGMSLYRPTIHPGLDEYYPRGHDDSVPAIPCNAMANRAKKGPLDLSFFYGGVGDARHFYQQLYHIHAYKEKRGDKLQPRDKFFLTVQDLKPHMMARNVVTFRLLHDVSTAETENEKLLLLAMVWYVFAGDIMPAFIYERLTNLIRALESGEGSNFRIPWLRCDKKTELAIREVLRYWLAEEYRERYDVKYAQTKLLWNKGQSLLNQQPFSHPQIKAEWEQFEASLLVYPPLQLLEEKEPELAALIQSNRTAAASKRKKVFSEYAQKKWRTNVLLLQEREWYEEPWNHNWDDSSCPLHTITDLLHGIPKKKPDPTASPPSSMIDVILPFFRSCAAVLSQPGIIVECNIAEVYQQLDSIRFGTTVEREGLPTTFNSIFLSNIPDYTGGHLSVTLHALPLLKKGQPLSYVQSNILVNPLCFNEGLPQTLAEYTCLPSLTATKQLLGLTNLKRKSPDDDNPFLNMIKPSIPTLPWATLTEPHLWTFSPPPSTLPKKAVFSRWLTQLFFKFALPVPRDIDDVMYRIHQPLTLSSFIYLCIFLVEHRGIPQHWVASTVETLLTGTISTAAGPPTSAPLLIEELSFLAPESAPVKQYHITPFIPELRALLIKFQPLLPFTLLSPPLPPRSALARFEVELEIWDVSVGPTMSVLALVFFAPTARGELASIFREVVERGGGRVAEKVLIVGGFTWRLGGVASWVLERRVLGDMVMVGWRVGVVRTDSGRLVEGSGGLGGG